MKEDSLLNNSYWKNEKDSHIEKNKTRLWSYTTTKLY